MRKFQEIYLPSSGTKLLNLVSKLMLLAMSLSMISLLILRVRDIRKPTMMLSNK